MTDACSGGERAAAPTVSLDASDPELHYEEEEEEEEASSGSSEPSDTSSIFSDDSVYPCYEVSPEAGGAGFLSLYQCCARNDAKLVWERLERGVTRSEATELDINGRNALMVACSKGFVDIVPLLQKCPYININQQDNDGNTALMMAAQAGHITIVNYLLNYYPALEVDQRDPRGLTALMKAAVQGRQDCVTALLLAGADLQAVDAVKGKTAREWATFTGRFETTVRIRSLLRRPRAEQFAAQYQPEWPALAELVAKALSPKSRSKRLSEKIRSIFTLNIPRNPEEDGVLDHMVRMTTSLASPFVATACQTVCPDSPPEVGKRRLSVPEILGQHVADPDEQSETSSRPSTGGSSCNGQAVAELRPLPPPPPPPRRFLSFLPLWLRRGNSVFPGEPVPKIKVSKASGSGSGERKPRVKDKHLLQPPQWRYKVLKEEKKAAEEAKTGEKKKKKDKKKKKG
ncbi:photoreceptor ankyrin repeat protein [Motacilla alba alba]|uniref:photoreceptor ankyrin repeat protein n=1 Tax=Motacilla alba alba TaxID=1094192 RepID=UPI0018D535C5|nr:photoreceptor ankyrin repeat protein [Motacilla alba alba]